MQISKVFCLFEQSGTFKNEFKKFGIHAEDYDILNDFGETDHQVDLFSEIEKAYSGTPSLFDEVGSGDLVLAFFPCTRFECQSQMLLNGNHYTAQNWSDEQKWKGMTNALYKIRQTAISADQQPESRDIGAQVCFRAELGRSRKRWRNIRNGDAENGDNQGTGRMA